MKKILSLVLGLLWVLPSWAVASSDYTKLEYIESTGTQYIDTGYKFSAGNKFEVVLNPLNNIQQGWFFGANSSGGEVLFSNASIYFGASFRPSTASTSGLFPTTNTIYKITGDMRGASSNQSSLLIDDNLIWQGTGTFNDRKIYLFAVISSATDESSLARQKIRIYGFKIWQNDTIVQDLIPVKRHSDGVICMYDMVTGEFFENAGSGEFVAGPVAEIKIATTKYNETAFSPLNTALANAISVVDTVVSNTIAQAGRIATLQTQKQTRPADDPSDANNAENCPAGKKCLLVEDASGVPHWYEIVEQYSRLPDGYTELQYIESTGTQYIDTGITLGGGTNYKNTDIKLEYDAVINQGTRWQVSGTLGSAGIFIGVNPENNIAYNAGQTPDIISGVTNPYVRCLWINDAPNGRVTVKNMITGVNILDATYTPAIKTNLINILLFNYSVSDGSASNNYMYGKMYGAKIYNNGTLIRNFVPAKNASGVVGMYDTVSGRSNPRPVRWFGRSPSPSL